MIGIFLFWLFAIFCGHFGVFPRFGMLYREKSGNPVTEPQNQRRPNLSEGPAAVRN
jgi:hypothetical protein